LTLLRREFNLFGGGVDGLGWMAWGGWLNGLSHRWELGLFKQKALFEGFFCVFLVYKKGN